METNSEKRWLETCYDGFRGRMINKLIIAAVMLLGGIILTGCANAKFYSDPGLKNKTGLRYYTAKPYLLVEYHAEKDNTVKTSIVYLPDMQNPQYLILRTGIGANDLKMAFENSTLTSYGIASESMFSETMEAVASMLSKSAYAAQGFTGPQKPAAEPDAVHFRLYEIDGAALKEVVIGQR